MRDPEFNDILAVYREIWTTRLYYVAVLAGCAGVLIGYLIRVWFG